MSFLLLIGKDVYASLSDQDKKEFTDISKKYESGEYYIDQKFGEMPMMEFTGDENFPDLTDLTKFGELADEDYGEYYKLAGMKVYKKEFDALSEKEINDWKNIAEEVGHPDQIFVKR